MKDPRKLSREEKAKIRFKVGDKIRLLAPSQSSRPQDSYGNYGDIFVVKRIYQWLNEPNGEQVIFYEYNGQQKEIMSWAFELAEEVSLKSLIEKGNTKELNNYIYQELKNAKSNDNL